MALLDRLLALHRGVVPLEDFFTEVYADFVDQYPAALVHWLSQTISGLDSSSDVTAVTTQVTFAALEGHAKDSRPDLIVVLRHGLKRTVVFIESKVGSSEGYEQLPRYAQQLAHHYPDPEDRKILLYVTRDFDPKQASIISTCSGGMVEFHQSRWSSAYRSIRYTTSREPRPGIERFMQKHNLAMSTQFTPDQLASMVAFPRTLKMMEESLLGRVQETLRIRFKHVIRSATRYNDLGSEAHFTLQSRFPVSMKTIYVGYSLEEEQTGETGYAAVGAWLSVHHNSVSRVAHVKAMTAGCPEGWKLVAIDDPKNNATLCRVQPMSSFLGNTNHIVALEEYFVGLIKNLDDFANANPELDWKAQGE